MKKLFSKAIDAADLETDLIPGTGIIEVIGNNRVLVENHISITEYTDSTVCIRMKFGCACIHGTDLIIHKMCKEQLVIAGNISCIKLAKGGV